MQNEIRTTIQFCLLRYRVVAIGLEEMENGFSPPTVTLVLRL